MAFWQIVLLFSAIAVLFTIWPLIAASFRRKADLIGVRHDETQVQLFQQHLAELERIRALGDIDEAQFEELKLELQKNLVAEGVPDEVRKSTSGGRNLVIAMAVAVPVVSLVLYYQWGAKGDWEIYQLLEELPRVETREAYEDKLRVLALTSQKRLNKTPDNHQLRNLLAQTSMTLQDYDKAVDAYRKILDAFPESPRVIANLAQALFYRAGHVVTPEVREYTQKALSLAPMMPEMLGLAGIDAKNQGDYRGAIRYWRSAVQHMDPNSRVAQGYLAGIANAEQALVVAGQTAEQDSQAAEQESDQPRIRLNISLGEGVSINGNETLFVYARAWQGPRVPLAIQRLSAAQLPVRVSLDESMAMAPGMTINSFPELEVVARVSRSGNATAQSGDWQGKIGPIKLDQLDGSFLELVISERLP